MSIKPIKITMFSTKKADKVYFDAANQNQKFIINYVKESLDETTAEKAAGSQAVSIFTNDTANRAIINKLATLGVKCIALRCAGYDNVDLKTAKNKIKVVNVPSYSPYSVAEHAMAMLLCLNRHIREASANVQKYNFNIDDLTGFELHNKTIGVIGTGKIGKCFIEICRGFGAKVIAYDKFPDKTAGIKYVSLDELYRRSDIISLHCPLNEETKHLINQEAIKKIKNGAIIINVSRGELINSKALLKALNKGKIYAACLDVYEDESNIFFKKLSSQKIEDKTLKQLLSMPNVLITPHQAFLTEEALNNIAKTTLKNISECINNRGCENELA